jgi:hypothetical protein
MKRRKTSTMRKRRRVRKSNQLTVLNLLFKMILKKMKNQSQIKLVKKMMRW